MNAMKSISVRSWCAFGLVGLILLITSACGPTPTPTVALAPSSVPAPTVTPPCDTSTTVSPIVNDIAKNVGQVISVAGCNAKQLVIAFEETHVSPAGQIEIAVMLNRLYEKYGLRKIGLEGAFAKDGNLDAIWFNPSLKAQQPITPQADVIVQSLENGEISHAEMMALIYNDVQVTGIELQNQYEVEIPKGADSTTIVYLYQTAMVGMTQSQIRQANDLINQKKEKEAIEFILNTNEFTKATYAKLSDAKTIMSVEAIVNLIDEIEKKATQVGAKITADDKANLAAQRKFYQTASDRTKTMVDNTLLLVKQSSNAPVAMIMGAAHTEGAVTLFKQSGVSFAIIRPNSLANGQNNGNLSSKAYDRKLSLLSVDRAGGLGALLDGRKKPRPVIGELWFKSEAELSWLTTIIARASAQGSKLPFNDALKDVLPKLKSVTLVPNTLKASGKDVIFSVKALDRNSKPVQIWVRTRADKITSKKLLEERLLEASSNVQRKEKPDDSKPESSELKLERVSSDTISKFSKSQSAIENTNLGG